MFCEIFLKRSREVPTSNVAVLTPGVFNSAYFEHAYLAHEGFYDLYTNAAHKVDGIIADLWQYIQSNPQYKDKTTLFATCDHGRGDDGGRGWRDHGTKVKDSNQIWFAVMGPDTPAKGEMTQEGQWYQNQFATTFAKLLGCDFGPTDHPAGKPIPEVMH